jgi:hypothetical protein
MPVIPAWIVRANLDDPRKIPYLLVWKDERECHGTAYRVYDGETKEAVRGIPLQVIGCEDDEEIIEVRAYLAFYRASAAPALETEPKTGAT